MNSHALASTGYWKIRGLAGPIRLLCAYADETIEEKQYEQGDETTGFSRDVWYNEKETLGLDYPNLPYFIDGDIKLTQSGAILRYLARKHELLGKDAAQAALVDVIIEESMDFNRRFTGLCYNPDFEKLKPAYLERLPYYLDRCEKQLVGKWFAGGDEVTAADFCMWHQIEQITLLEPGCLNAYPRLKAFIERFENLPKIKTYMASDTNWIHWPVNNKSSTFGGKGPDPRPPIA